MKSDLRQLGEETAIYGISTILSRFLNFLLVPFFTNIFTQAEYGIITNVYAYIAFFNIIFLYGMDTAYLKFSSTKELGDEKETFSTAFNSVFLSSLIFSSLILIFKNSLQDLFGLEESQILIVYFVAGILFFDAISNVIFARLRFHNKAFRFAGIKTFNIICNVGFNIFLIYNLKFRAEGVFIANFISSFFTFLILIPVLIKSYVFTINKELFTGLLKFGLPFVPAGFAAIVTQVIDRPIMLALTDASTVGIYQANYKLGIFMMLFVSMFQYAWQPFYLKKASQPTAKQLFSKVFTYFTLVGSIIFLLLSLFIDDLVKIKIFGFYIIGKDFWSGLNIVPVVLLGYLFNGFYIVFLAGLQIEKKTQFMPLVTGTGAFVNVVANLILIPVLGIMGAALATLMAYLSMAIYQYILSQKFYRINYEWRKIAINMILLFIVFNSYLILKEIFNPAPDNMLNHFFLVLKTLVFVVYIGFLWLFKLIDFKWIKELYISQIK